MSKENNFLLMLLKSQTSLINQKHHQRSDLYRTWPFFCSFILRHEEKKIYTERFMWNVMRIRWLLDWWFLFSFIFQLFRTFYSEKRIDVSCQSFSLSFQSKAQCFSRFFFSPKTESFPFFLCLTHHYFFFRVLYESLHFPPSYFRFRKNKNK